MRILRGISAAALMLFTAGALFAAGNDTGMWDQIGLNKSLPNNWRIQSDIQFRFRDNFSDFYWFRWEGGPGVKVNKWLDLLVYFRIQPGERTLNHWTTEYHVMIDPVFKLYSNPAWTVDFRTRIHQKLDLGRSYFRVRPRVSRKFKLGNTPTTWYIYDDARFETTALKGKRDRLNFNWAATGLNIRLDKKVALDLGYLMESSQNTKGQWSSLHVLNAALNFSF